MSFWVLQQGVLPSSTHWKQVLRIHYRLNSYWIQRYSQGKDASVQKERESGQITVRNPWNISCLEEPFAPSVKALPGMPVSRIRRLALSLTLLPFRNPGRVHPRKQWMMTQVCGSYHPHGRPRLSSGLLAWPGLALALMDIWGINQWVEGLCLHAFQICKNDPMKKFKNWMCWICIYRRISRMKKITRVFVVQVTVNKETQDLCKPTC